MPQDGESSTIIWRTRILQKDTERISVRQSEDGEKVFVIEKRTRDSWVTKDEKEVVNFGKTVNFLLKDLHPSHKKTRDPR